MRVLCIDANLTKPDMPALSEGEVYTVSEQKISPNRQILHFSLAEIGEFFFYDARHFIETSSIDESELYNQRFHEKTQTI